MTAVCSGGPSGPKPQSPAVSYFAGNQLEDLIQEALGISEAWASLLVFAAAQVATVETATFCASDPPTLTWPSASDILYITTHPWDITDPSFANLWSVIQNGLWWLLCECQSVATPPPPTAPPYPTSAPSVNPPGYGGGTAMPCYQQNNGFVYQPVGGNGFVIPLPPSIAVTSTPDIVTVVATGEWTLFSGVIAGHLYQFSIGYFDTSNVSHTLAAVNMDPLNDGSGAGKIWTCQATIPSPNHGWFVQENSSGSGEKLQVAWTAQAWCGGQTPTTSIGPCCPPDPTLTTMLIQIQQQLDLIYQGLPGVPTALAESTIHSGISGNGTITLASSALAIKVEITTDQPLLGSYPGNPNYLLDRGFVVPIINEGPVTAFRRIIYNPQVFMLPPLTEQIGYTIANGVVVKITELVKGP